MAGRAGEVQGCRLQRRLDVLRLGVPSAPGYAAAYRDWLTRIDRILAPHQITRGGSIILYNVENEYAVNTDAAYMDDLQRKARADGIDVPITTNVCCDAASWVSTWASGPGAVQIPGVDDYPQSFDCPHADTTWGPWGAGLTERLRDDAPVFAAEYQAGAIDSFNAGFDACRELTGPAYIGSSTSRTWSSPAPPRSTTTWASAAPTGAGWASPTTSTPPTTTARRSPRTAS